MRNILLAWEFGQNWGHLARDLPIVARLAGNGHRVVCAAIDTRVAVDMFDSTPITFVQAPSPRRTAQSPKTPVSHAEIALTGGYDDPSTLRGLVGAWRGIFELTHPDVLMIDYAPTAVLAAQTCGVPTVLAGTGFELPPRVTPLPSFRTWETVQQSRLLHAEELVLKHANQVLEHWKAAPIQQFAQLFQGRQRILTTFPELDHFGARPEEEYVGPVGYLPQAQQVQWLPAEGRKRIFAYLRPWTTRIEDLLSALRRSGADVICAFPGAPPQLVQRYSSPRLRIFSAPVAINPLLAEASLIIAYGSGTVASALLAGAPVLLIPRWAEQYLTALRVEALGAGLAVRGNGLSSYPAVLEQLLSDPQYRTAAQRFAAKYTGHDAEQAITRIVNVIANID